MDRLEKVVGAAAFLGALTAFVGPAEATNASYYVDCSAGSNGTGTQASPWNNLSTVTGTTFGQGDRIYFKRGMTCSGAVWPKGSGVSGNPIMVDAYGSGARPIISAGTNQYAFKLSDQEYWSINNIETTGGTRYGVFITATTGVKNYFRLSNLKVHDVRNGSLDSKNTGLVVVSPTHDSTNSTSARFNDVVIDNVEAYGTTMWSGILIGTGWNADSWVSNTAKRSSNVTIRNSVTHDVYGDGIVAWAANSALIESSVAYDTGKQPSPATLGTPNGIWTWGCKDCTMQDNEAYANLSPTAGTDGGGFDIDTADDNNILQYNYAHNNQGYCFAILGWTGQNSTNSIARYNTCSNNGGGEIQIYTWDSGLLDGVQVYNNTITTTVPVFGSWPAASFTGSRPNFFKNNLVRTTSSNVLGTTTANVARNYNLYYYTGGTFSSGEANSVHNKDPMLVSPTYAGYGMPDTELKLLPGSPAIDAGTNVCSGITGCSMGSRDFYGNNNLQGSQYDIGAHEYSNLLANASFESGGAGTQTPASWSESWPAGQDGTSSFTESSPGTAHSGTFYGAHYKATAYEIYTYQAISVPNGTYTVRAWTISGGGQTTAQLRVKNFGGTDTSTAIPATSSWTLLTIPNVNVTNGNIEVGIYSLANAGNYLRFDDIQVERVSLLNNASFEADGATSSPSNWSKWSSSGDVSPAYTESYQGAHNGTYHASHWKGSAYDIFLYKTLSIANGTYTVRAWVRNSGNQKVAQLQVKDYAGAGTLKTSAIPTSSSNYVRVTIRDVVVTAGSMTVGIYSDANANDWIHFDDIELMQQ